MKLVNLFDEVEMISRTAQTVLLGRGGSTGGSGEEEDPPWIYPNSGTTDYNTPVDNGG